MNKSDISIHAPKRERRPASPAFTSSTLFQSTLPNGSDPGYMIIRCWGEVFQSTLPNGSDGYTDINDLGQKISIHAPKRERPHVFNTYCDALIISIHAPKRERHYLPDQ